MGKNNRGGYFDNINKLVSTVRWLNISTNHEVEQKIMFLFYQESVIRLLYVLGSSLYHQNQSYCI